MSFFLFHMNYESFYSSYLTLSGHICCIDVNMSLSTELVSLVLLFFFTFFIFSRFRLDLPSYLSYPLVTNDIIYLLTTKVKGISCIYLEI